MSLEEGNCFLSLVVPILNRQPCFFVCVPVTGVARLASVLLLQTQNSEMRLGGPMIKLIETLTILHNWYLITIINPTSSQSCHSFEYIPLEILINKLTAETFRNKLVSIKVSQVLHNMDIIHIILYKRTKVQLFNFFVLTI